MAIACYTGDWCFLLVVRLVIGDFFVTGYNVIGGDCLLYWLLVFFLVEMLSFNLQLKSLHGWFLLVILVIARRSRLAG